MLNFKDALEGEKVVRVHDMMPGEILEVGERRPIRAKVKWQDGSEQWMHPEQIRKPSAVAPQPSIALSGFGRTTPDYLITLRKKLRNERQPRVFKPSKVALEHDANRILFGPKGRKRKKIIEGLKSKYGERPRIPQLPMIQSDPVILDKPAWHYPAETERESMKKLYQEKSGDYSY